MQAWIWGDKQSISANSAKTWHISIEKSGYVPIAIIGIGIDNGPDGAGNSWCVVRTYGIQYNNNQWEAYINIRNVNTATVTIYAQVGILYSIATGDNITTSFDYTYPNN